MDLEKLVSDESVEDFASAHECDSAFFVSAKTGNIWTNTCDFGTSITLAQKPPFNVQVDAGLCPTSSSCMQAAKALVGLCICKARWSSRYSTMR